MYTFAIISVLDKVLNKSYVQLKMFKDGKLKHTSTHSARYAALNKMDELQLIYV